MSFFIKKTAKTTQFLYRPAQKPHKNWMIFFHRAPAKCNCLYEIFSSIKNYGIKILIYVKVINTIYFFSRIIKPKMINKNFGQYLIKLIHFTNLIKNG